MFDQLIGQEKIKHYFSREIDSGKMHQAYLLHGPGGVGKTAAAIDLAKIVTCHNTDQRPCGECHSCVKFKTMDHPDVSIYFPVQGAVKPEEILRMRLEIATDPYTQIKIGSLHIDMVRDIKRKFRLQSYQGHGRVVILLNCESLTPDAGNALLKILEEPPSDVRFLLTAATIDDVPLTVRSRCQLMHLSYLPADRIAEALIERLQLNPGEASMYARLSGGSYARALEFSSEEFSEIRNNCKLILKSCLTDDQEELIGLAEKFSQKSNAPAIKSILELMIDVLKQRFEYAAFLHREKSEFIHLFSLPQAIENLEISAIEAAIIETEKSVDLINKNVYLYLILFTLFSKLNSIFNYGSLR